MRQLALAQGMLKSAFLVEPASRNTVENAREAARLLRPQGRNTVLLVSDRSHLPRAILLFRLTGLRVAGWAGVPPRSLLWETGAAIREFAALPGSLLRALFGPSHYDELASIPSALRQRRISRSSASTAPQAKPRQVSSTSLPSRILVSAAVMVTSRARATRDSIESRVTRMCSKHLAPPSGPREVAMIATGLYAMTEVKAGREAQSRAFFKTPGML